MSKFIFVTGTDTEVGKTKFTTLVLKHYVEQRLARGWKPIAAGAEAIDGKLYNDDALAIQQAADIREYDEVNPLVFAPPIAPHIAAEQAGVPLNSQVLNSLWSDLPRDRPFILVEGAGGWNLPLNYDYLLSDWIAEKQWPVIVVVGMRLGCLNHALLTAEAIQQRGLQIQGWVANSISSVPMPHFQENLQSLTRFFERRFNAPLLMNIPYFQSERAEAQWRQEKEHFEAIDALFHDMMQK
ncbi:MAG: dethiobiotin synthetase BioD [Idiomarinaceae bacterium HL-53]|nr:MAG: dethiobiotin synthetase BioD [Idiomarinaceae bacterium HL-53]CUS48961.1 dethiobiotin synthetase [Idiomarinaceae bacterium HL-53]